ncbi:hypothetical protein GTY54_28675 [Streptomyces sp. SID625]|nr:hypothetical protein [Streptomyces sp. SID625]
MFGLITRRHHEQALEQATAFVVRLRDERDQAADERDAFKAAALTAARQVADVADARRPVDGGTCWPVQPSAELLRTRAQVRALEARLAELQAASEARDLTDYWAAGGPRFDREAS